MRPSVQAMKRMGQDFKESDSDSSAMIVLEGQQPLGDDAHQYYDGLVRELRDDPKHVQHVQDFWGDRLTASGVQSPDGKAVYVQVNLVGDQGTPSATNPWPRSAISWIGRRRRPGSRPMSPVRHRSLRICSTVGTNPF